MESINSVYENFNTDNYSSYLIEYTGEIKSEIVDKLDIFLFKINEEYAVLFIRSDMINDFEDTLEVISLINSYFKGNNFEVIYVVPPDIYTLQQVSAIQASNVGMLQTELALNLTGKGVVVGIIDTGIDYLSNEFKDSNGNTRIDSILDQNLGLNKVNDNLILGNIYNKEQIDEAIRARDNGRDPYSIVPSKDEIGHGTNMAGIIGGTGKNPALKGVAPECEFVSVKLLEAKFLKKRLGIKEPIYNIASIFLAIEYLRRYHVESGKPMVILLPLGSNSGNHKGSHILDNYIASVSFNLGIVIVTGTGNEGAEDLHTSGIIKNIGDYSTIEMIVEKNQAILYMEIWMGVPDIIEVNVVSPSGLDTGYIPAILDIRKKYSFVFEQTKISIYYALPEEYSGDQLIRLYFYDIKPGIWNINVRLKLGRMAEYNAWLAQRALTLPGTRFISSTQYGTVTIPGDSRYAITVAAYNQNNNNLLSYSGVAFRDERNNAIDFAAGGYNTITVGPNNTIVTVSGTSLAAAVGAGACVLLFEWGIVNKNYPYMYSQTIKTFLTRGVYKRSGDIYPNPQLGYGIIDFYKIFENMS
ncbi:S8 family serine peptidase [Clostridium tertium]|uniref:PII-type proteinase n=1 Tax=Clostridium tertium TaxID=1559 RepID=A0A6N3FVF6_9CLOT